MLLVVDAAQFVSVVHNGGEAAFIEDVRREHLLPWRFSLIPTLRKLVREDGSPDAANFEAKSRRRCVTERQQDYRCIDHYPGLYRRA